MSKKKTAATLLINLKVCIYLHPSLLYSLQSTITVSWPQVLQPPKFLTPHLTMTTIIHPCWHWKRPLSKAGRHWYCQIVLSQHAKSIFDGKIQPLEQNLARHKHHYITNITLTPHHTIKSAHSLHATGGSSKKCSSSVRGSSWGARSCWPDFFICWSIQSSTESSIKL